jgi:hypothetical protein
MLTEDGQQQLNCEEKNNIHLHIISAYCCVKNIHGPLSVWNQQRYLLLNLEKTAKQPDR